MKIKIKKLHPQAKIPFKSTKEAACADVYATEIAMNGDIKCKVKLGFSTEIPLGFKGIIVPRSSFTQRGWIMQNSPAQIDSDYRGEWIIKFEAIPQGKKLNNLTYNSFPYKVGDRIAQIFFEKVVDYEFKITEDLVETQRGSGGFGSTGVK